MEITLKNVTYRHNQKTSFEHLNLTLEGPSIIGIAGKHKTQLLKLLDAIHAPSSGEVQIEKEAITRENVLSMRKKVSLVTQEISDQMLKDTVEAEMHFLVETLDYQNIDIKRRMVDSLQIVGLQESYLKKNITKLSMGEKKLVQLALALLCNPKIILLDEPLADLDYNNKRKMIFLIKMLREKYKKTIIIASNDSNFLYSLVQEMVILGEKNVEAQGKTETIFQDVTLLEKENLDVPYLVRFTKQAKEKKVRLSYHKDIRDLIKDIYKHV